MIQWFRDGCNERWLATIRQIREFLRRDFPQHRLSGGFDVRRLAYVFHLAGQPRARLVVSLKVLRYAWRLEPHLHQQLVEALSRGGAVRLTVGRAGDRAMRDCHTGTLEAVDAVAQTIRVDRITFRLAEPGLLTDLTVGQRVTVAWDDAGADRRRPIARSVVIESV